MIQRFVLSSFAKLFHKLICSIQVEQARNQALNDVRAENPNVDAKVLDVEVPKTTPAANAAAAAGVPGLPRVHLHDPLDAQHDRLRQALERAQVHVLPHHLEERLADLRERFHQNALARGQIMPLHDRMQLVDIHARAREHYRPARRFVRRPPAQPVVPVQPVPVAQPAPPVQPAPVLHQFPAYPIPPNMQPVQIVPHAPPGAIVAYANAQPHHHPALHININANLLPPNAHYVINHNQIIRQPAHAYAPAPAAAAVGAPQIQHVGPQQQIAAALQAAVAAAPPPQVVMQPPAALPAARRRRRVR